MSKSTIADRAGVLPTDSATTIAKKLKRWAEGCMPTATPAHVADQGLLAWNAIQTSWKRNDNFAAAWGTGAAAALARQQARWS